MVAAFHRAGGAEAAIVVAKQRSGSHFDPALVNLFCEQAPMLLSDLDSATSWDAVIAAEPQLQRLISEEKFEDALKSPWTIGHSRGVADLAAEAARGYGLPERDVVMVRRCWPRARPRSPRDLERDLGQAAGADLLRDGAGPHAPLAY